MPSAQYDLGYLRAGLESLEAYLLSNDLYWPIGASSPAGETPYPQLTLGGMLLALARLEARSLSAEQQAELASLAERIDAARSRWRVAWEAKASKELGSRLNLWRDFLEEYRDKPEQNADRYAYEVGRRVQLHLIGPDAATASPAQVEMLRGLDRLLQAVFQPGEFIWDASLAKGFPMETYWYLYGKLKS